MISATALSFAVDLIYNDDRALTTIVLFVRGAAPIQPDLKRLLDSHERELPLAETLYVIGPRFSLSQLQLTRDRAIEMVGAHLSCHVGTVESNGRILFDIDPRSPDMTQSMVESNTARIFAHGMMDLFTSGSCVLRAESGYHFETPAERHVRTFVRAGGLFVSSVGCAFAACALLGHLPDVGSIQTIFTDTSTINGLAQELSQLAVQFGATSAYASVSSTNGLSGLVDPPAIVPDETLFLVSVNFTGSLLARIQEVYPDCPRLVSVVSLAKKQTAPSLLQPFQFAPEGYIDLDAPLAADCKLCAELGETVVHIESEQLIPQTPSVYSRLLTLGQAKQWKPPHLEALYEADVTRVYVQPHAGGEPSEEIRHDVYFDFSPLLSELTTDRGAVAPAVKALLVSIEEELGDLVQAFDPTCILHASDRSSELLAFEAQRLSVTDPTVLSLDELWDGDHSLEEGQANRFLFISSVSSSGRSISAASRLLRPFTSTGFVKYFIMMPRAQDAEMWRSVQDNLSTGSGKTDPNPVRKVFELWLPQDRALPPQVWREEEEYWQKLLASRALEADAVRQIDSRLAALDSGSLHNNLFLVTGYDINSVERRLVLQRRFAFWEFEYEPERVSQALVYMTFVAVADWSRALSGSKATLAPRDALRADKRFYDTRLQLYNTTVLHPFNFVRYDDPITQGALLRAALRQELNYTASPALSAAMLDVLLRVVDDYVRHPERESALAEYLLALASGRLRLQSPYTAVLLRKMPKALPPVMRALVATLNAAPNATPSGP